MAILIELANVSLLLMTTGTVNLISNFVSIVILNEFDNFVYVGMKDESLKKLIIPDFTETVCRINHTTSKKCSKFDLSDVQDEDGNARPLKIQWGDRKNKCCRCFYGFNRVFFVSVYFYFLPFMAMITQCVIPIYIRMYGLKCE